MIKLSDEIYRAIKKFTNLSRGEFKQLTREVMEKYEIIPKKEQKEYQLLVLLEKFLFSLRTEKKSEKTIDGYRLQITKFSERVNKDIRRISTDDIREYISYLVNTRKNADGTINNYLHILQSFFKWCIVEGYLSQNPIARIKINNFKPKRNRVGLDGEKLEAVKYACEDLREKLIIELYVSTGCRLSEIAEIDVKDINQKERSIEVIGKGNKKRTVFCSEKCKLLIEEYMKKEAITDGALLRSNKKPHGRLKPSAIQSIIKEIGERTNIKLYPHLLRHTFATNSRKHGMSLETIQILLGHASITTTQIYAKEDMEKIKNEYNRIA
ncbi:hypothetical protein C3V36_14585 [Lachnospiraceae bacterium oral taxon 500]|nr:hypothetical protein C3V36_07305 [Lachnospiraceae bacterium oral taxon 500]AVM70365.1 hypothetical protein C3V36_14585 [Lachnospiraceae bacterium oral taxon 500]